MAFKKIVEDLLQKALEEKTSLFVIDFSISTSNNVLITLDGDQGVTLQDCIDISRLIENNIDKEVYDYGLEVASCGATSPIKNFRQFNKNIGRLFVITTLDEKIEGTLVGLEDDQLLLEWQKNRQRKRNGAKNRKNTFRYNKRSNC